MNTTLKTFGAAIVASSLAFVASLGVSSCASGELASCESDEDCESGAQCIDGSCQSPDGGLPDVTGGGPGGGGDDTGSTTGDITVFDSGNNGNGGDGGDGYTPPTDSNGGNGDTTGGGSGGTDTGGTDTGSMDCSGGCGIGKECGSGGTCVSRCQPTCNAGQQCADRGDGYQCYDTCNEANSTDGCPQSGTRCIDLVPNENNREVLICDNSDCSTTAECTAGTCINFENDYGQCVQNGNKSVGETCSVGECEDGVFCVGDSQTGSGTCREECDPWNASCSSGKCSLFENSSSGFSSVTLRQGWCNTNTTSEGTSNLQTCSPTQSMCDNAIRCLTLGSEDRCAKWCRPGEGDCAGTIPPSFNGTGICNNYIFGGVRAVGQCVPSCSSDSDCASGTTCVNDICRRECTTASDCCNSSPCNFQCNGGLCE